MKIQNRQLKERSEIISDIIVGIRKQRQYYALQTQHDIAMDGKRIVYMKFSRALPSNDLILMSAYVIGEKMSSDILSVAEYHDRSHQFFPRIMFESSFVWEYAANRVKGLEPSVIGGPFDEYIKSMER